MTASVLKHDPNTQRKKVIKQKQKRLFVRTKEKQIFGVIPFVKLTNDNQKQLNGQKRRKMN